MAYFKQGDTVTVRSDLTAGSRYFCDGEWDRSSCDATTDMARMAGEQVTIEEVLHFDMSGVTRYYVKEDQYDYYWTDEMFDEYLNRNESEPDIELQTSEEFLSFLLS